MRPRSTVEGWLRPGAGFKIAFPEDGAHWVELEVSDSGVHRKKPAKKRLPLTVGQPRLSVSLSGPRRVKPGSSFNLRYAITGGTPPFTSRLTGPSGAVTALELPAREGQIESDVDKDADKGRVTMKLRVFDKTGQKCAASWSMSIGEGDEEGDSKEHPRALVGRWTFDLRHIIAKSRAMAEAGDDLEGLEEFRANARKWRLKIHLRADGTYSGYFRDEENNEDRGKGRWSLRGNKLTFSNKKSYLDLTYRRGKLYGPPIEGFYILRLKKVE